MWLSIDQGGHASRALVFDASGAVIARGEAPLETLRHAEWVEHEAGDLAASVRSALEQVAAQLGGRVGGLQAAGLATQRSTLVCLRRSAGTALSRVLSWQDRRGAELLARLGLDADRVRQLTGLRMSPHYGASKIRWLLEHAPGVRAAAAERDLLAAPLASFLLHALGVTTEWVVDPANASRTLLMDAHALDWSPELLDAFGLDRSMLPAIRDSRSGFGKLRLGAASVPLKVVSGDQSAALFCLGAPPVGTAFINIGTGAFIQIVTGQTPVSHPDLLASIVWSEGSRRTYVLEGTVNGAGAALDAQLAALGFSARPDSAALLHMLARPERTALFLNGVAGLGSPDWVADFPTQYLGPADREQRLAAVIDSIVFLIMRNLGVMRRLVPVERIVVTGGLAQLDWIPQQLATLCEQPVVRLADPEATARGLAFLVSNGALPIAPALADARTFAPLLHGEIQQRYRIWCEALQSVLTPSTRP
jgi:glycerol kinase